MYRNVINVLNAAEGFLPIAPLKCDRTGMKTSDLIFWNSDSTETAF